MEGCALKTETAHQNRNIFGILIILLGIAGLVIPVLPGWILILAGLALI